MRNKGLKEIILFLDVDDYDPTIVTKKPGDETSDEEKEWLNALEKGELNDYGELSKEKDPTLMTARQVRTNIGKQNSCFSFVIFSPPPPPL